MCQPYMLAVSSQASMAIIYVKDRNNGQLGVCDASLQATRELQVRRCIANSNIHPPGRPALEVYVAVTGKTFCSSAHASFVFFAKYPVPLSEIQWLRFEAHRATRQLCFGGACTRGMRKHFDFGRWFLQGWFCSFCYEPNAGANCDGQDGVCSVSTRKLLSESVGVLCGARVPLCPQKMTTLWCLRCATAAPPPHPGQKPSREHQRP